MNIHYLPDGSMVTSCELSVAGRDPVPVTNKMRDVTCPLCRMLNNTK